MKFKQIKSVMVVDDDPLFAEHLTSILKNEGLYVKSASNCLDALHAVSKEVPDLFLINWEMPTITGDRLCKILRSQPRLSGSYRVLLSTVGEDAEIDLEKICAHARVAKEPWKIMAEKLFRVLQKLDENGSRSLHDEKQAFEDEDSCLKDRLQHAQRMEAVGTLAGGIAHDFNNILQTILGYAQLSLFEDQTPPVVRTNLEEIQDSAQKATSLIRRLLVFGRKVDMDSQHSPVDLNRQVRNVILLLERTIPRMIQIEPQLDEDLKLIHADGNLLEQILMNLGVNARDAMPDGGHLTFRTRNVELDNAFCANHSGARPGQYVQLSVADTGIGMIDKVREHIFDPFFTTKKNGQGTGLGLAMVYGIVKDHDGFITCDSKPDEGTVFTLYFPATEIRKMVGTPRPTEQAITAGGTETILLVDDEQGIRDFGKKLLEKHGYTVRTADCGEEALDIFRRGQTHIDIAIVDLSMPGMGGLKCVKFLREAHPDCRVIISSGYAAKEQIKSALEAGAQEFISKPYGISDLLPKIHHVINLQ